MTMATSKTTLSSAPKGCAAMFPTTTDMPWSPAPSTSKLALQVVAKQFAGTTDETTDSKAETAIRLMLMADKPLSGKTLGIIGFGQSGRDIARRAHFGFGMKVVIHNRSAVAEDELDQINARQVEDMDHLLGQSDFVSLHCPADAENRHLIDALRLNRMKPDAHLINTAGSELVDEEALADALWYDTIAGAGLDVLPGKTAVCDRLKECENVTLLQAPGSPAQQSLMARCQ